MIRFDDTDYGETDIMKGLLAGVAGGLLASFLMEQFQAGWGAVGEAMQSSKKRGGRKPDPTTVKVANVISEKVTGRKLPGDYKTMAGEAVHYGMGASAAADLRRAGGSSPDRHARRWRSLRHRPLAARG